jgi:hypothetical protein
MGVYWFIFGLGLVAGGILTPFVIQWVKEWQDQDHKNRMINQERDRKEQRARKIKQMTCCGQWVSIDTPIDDHMIKYKFSKLNVWKFIPDLTPMEQQLAAATWSVGTGHFDVNNPTILAVWSETAFPNVVLIAPIILRSFKCDNDSWNCPLPGELYWFSPVPSRFKLDRTMIRRVNILGAECKICDAIIAPNLPSHMIKFGVLPYDELFYNNIMPLITSDILKEWTNIWFTKSGEKPSHMVVAWFDTQDNPKFIWYAEAVVKTAICSEIENDPLHKSLFYIPKEVARLTFTIIESTKQSLINPNFVEHIVEVESSDDTDGSDTSSNDKDDEEHILYPDRSTPSRSVASRPHSVVSPTSAISDVNLIINNAVMLIAVGPTMVGKSTFLSRYGCSFKIGDGISSTTSGIDVSHGKGIFEEAWFGDVMGFEDTRMPPAIVMFNILNAFRPISSSMKYIAPILVLPPDDLDIHKYINMVPELLNNKTLVVFNIRTNVDMSDFDLDLIKSTLPDCQLCAYNLLNSTPSQLAQIYMQAMSNIIEIPVGIGDMRHPWITSAIPRSKLMLDEVFDTWEQESVMVRKPLVHFETYVYDLLDRWTELTEYKFRYLNSSGPVSERFSDYTSWKRQYDKNLISTPTGFLDDADQEETVLVHKKEKNIPSVLQSVWERNKIFHFRFLFDSKKIDKISEKQYKAVRRFQTIWIDNYGVAPPYEEITECLKAFDNAIEQYKMFSPTNLKVVTPSTIEQFVSKLDIILPAWVLVQPEHKMHNLYYAMSAVLNHRRDFRTHTDCKIVPSVIGMNVATQYEGTRVPCTDGVGHYILTKDGIVRCDESDSLDVFDSTATNFDSPMAGSITLPRYYPKGQWVRLSHGFVYNFTMGNDCYHRIKRSTKYDFILVYADGAYNLTQRPTNPVGKIFPPVKSTIDLVE